MIHTSASNTATDNRTGDLKMNTYKINLKRVLEVRLKIAHKRMASENENPHWENEIYFLEDMICLIDTISED